MKIVKKQPSRLRPFDQQDCDYFEDNKSTTFDGCIEGLECQLQIIKVVSTTVENFKKARGEVGLSSVEVETFAQISRNRVRDLKVYVNQLMKHLEQIEVKGEWK